MKRYAEEKPKRIKSNNTNARATSVDFLEQVVAEG